MIKLKGINYRVITFEPAHSHEPIPLGVIDQVTAKIYLRRDADEQIMEETIWHELFHAVGMYENLSENAISRMSADLYAVLVDNGLLAEGWKDKIIDEFDENVGDLDDIDPVRPVDRAEEESLAR